MATRSIVPRADGEGSVGTAAKKWGGLWAKKINGDEPNLFYLVRLNSTEYIVGDVAFTPSLPSSFYLKCIEAGTTAASEPTYTSPEVGGTVTDGTVVWQYYDLLSASGTPLGAILPYSANAQTPPHGFLFCEGQAVSRTMYADLFALIGTTYGAGDGSTTFNLPNVLDKYPQGAQTAGTVKAAGLPDITGRISVNTYNYRLPYLGAETSGAFERESDITISSASGSTSTTINAPQAAKFKASNSNSIYGNSTTVTPPTLTVRWIIKAYDAPTPSSAQIDLSQYASDLANRLTREQTPAFNRRDVITTSGTYTAPVSGWYKITVKGGGGGGGGGLSSSSRVGGGGGGGEGGTTIAFEKMTAGQTATVVIGAGGAGGAAGSSGSNGGNSTVTVNSNTYTGGRGGYGPAHETGGKGGIGGTGTIPGAPGGTGNGCYVTSATSTFMGGNGGGNGGGIQSTQPNGIDGGGGYGGAGQSNSGATYAGGAGGNGYCWFEYFDPSLN